MKNIPGFFNLNKRNTVPKRVITGAALFLLLVSIAQVSCSKNNNTAISNINPVATNTVNITGMAFSPASITTTAGTTVTWTNNDNMEHTVTANDNSFDSGIIAVGGTYSRTFSSIGSFSYHCTVHPSMKGTVTVK